MESSSHKSTPKRKQTPRKPPARHGTKRAVKKGTTPESKSPTKRRRAAIKRAVEVLAALGDAQSNDGQGSAEESSYEDISEEDNSSESTKSSHRKSARKRKGSTKSTEESPTKKPRVEGKFVSLSSSYMSKISKSFGALDKRLFDCGYGGGARSEALQVVCNKVKDFIDAEKAVLVNIGSRKNYTWDDMYKIWCNYAERNEVRKNRVPLTLRRLSGWVHQQRKDYKDELLSEKQIELLQCKGFDFHPRATAKTNKAASGATKKSGHKSPQKKKAASGATKKSGKKSPQKKQSTITSGNLLVKEPEPPNVSAIEPQSTEGTHQSTGKVGKLLLEEP